MSGSAPLPSGRRRTRRGGAPREGAGARADGRLSGPMGAAAAARPPRRAPSRGPLTPPAPHFQGVARSPARSGLAVSASGCGRERGPAPAALGDPARPPSVRARNRARGRLRPQVCGCVSGPGGRRGRRASAAASEWAPAAESAATPESPRRGRCSCGASGARGGTGRTPVGPKCGARGGEAGASQLAAGARAGPGCSRPPRPRGPLCRRRRLRTSRAVGVCGASGGGAGCGDVPAPRHGEESVAFVVLDKRLRRPSF
nr:collagen alpha-1(I) chain-like [Equus caballus]